MHKCKAGIMLDNKALTELVETVIRRQFSDAVVHAVAVKPDVDHDGEDILRVTVVVQDGIEGLDPKRCSTRRAIFGPSWATPGSRAFPSCAT